MAIWSFPMSPKTKYKGGNAMQENENVIPIRKADRFYLTKGHVTKTGEVVERERVGVAYLKTTSTMFRLRLWMFPRGEYFLAREDGEHTRYLALCREEFETPDGITKNQWHKIGVGEVVGNFIRIRFHLFSEDIFLCLFPRESNTGEVLDVV
jgi:hypothetical protein